ncbi:MAG: T9SS type A sorting domain-containing protein [Bacteroidales bacterium]|nr:T9SS type A sorting domain-containing protein [Bacteroidales bacterium]
MYVQKFYFINVSFDFQADCNYRIELFNVLGNKFSSFEYQGNSGNNISIPTGNLSEGFYILAVFSGNQLLEQQKFYVID